ncbi:trypco2 family protein [Streptomyces ziwulingensis]|uniref:Trypsin-co-occurring domain-containing protein n=1 Tax=Streptomyces ziwulingensis TaxID=1045501 RepID=A0ABP9BG25_9ACTN
MSEDDRIELADAVEAVRNELITAAARASGQDVAFEVGDIQLEFGVELRKELKGGLKVKAWVVEAGVDGGGGTVSTHRVAVTLKAVDARTGGPWRVRNADRGSVGRFGQDSDAP